MENKDFMRKFLAGLFFLAGVILMGWVVLSIGVEKGLTQPKFQIKVLFKEIGGLVVGAPITLSGVNVGTVADINFLEEPIEDRTVAVQMNIYEKFRKPLEKSTKVEIITEGVLGEKLVEISIDLNQPPIDLTKPIVGVDPLSVQDLAKTFGNTADALLETTRAINGMITEMRNISVASKRLLNRIEQRLIDGNLFKVF